MVPTGAPPPAKLTVVILSPLICRSCGRFSWNGGVELPGVPEFGELGLLYPSRALKTSPTMPCCSISCAVVIGWVEMIGGCPGPCGVITVHNPGFETVTPYSSSV